MGAPFRIWVQRVAGTLAAIAGAFVVAALPAPLWLRASVLATAALVAVGRAFRRIPAFDPLGRIRWRLPLASRRRRLCALTFDDGPSPSTKATLDILAADGVRATFFVLAGNAERHPELVRRARAEGHAIGLHGLDHTKLTGAGEAEVERQVAGASETLARLGVATSPIYRTPHGCKSRAVFEVARRHGLTLWAWSRGVWDTDRPEPGVLVRRATRLARPGMVLLLHDGHDDETRPDVGPMLAALPAIVRELKRRGFAFVTLENPGGLGDRQRA